MDDALGLLLNGRAAYLAAHLHDLTGGLGRANHFEAFGGAEGEGLLAVHVFAGGNGVQHHGLVPMIGSGDEHGFDGFVGEDRAVVARFASLATHAVDGALHAALVGVAYCRDLGSARGRQVAHELVRARAATDDADLNPVVGRHGLGAACGGGGRDDECSAS